MGNEFDSNVFKRDFYRVSGFWETWIARLFGKRFTSVDDHYTVYGSIYKGKWYIFKMKERGI